MITKLYEVTITVEVTIDETKFDEKFMSEFRQSFYPFRTIDDHMQHLAKMTAQGVIEGYESDSPEAYGPLGEMGIKTELICDEVEEV